MATIQDIIDKVKLRLKRSNDAALDVVIQDELDTLQKKLERGPIYPWFLVTELTDYTMTVGEPRVPLPDDFIVEYEDSVITIEDPDDGSLSKVHKTILENIYPRPDLLATPETPENYALAGDVFRFAPTPNKAYVIKMMYYAREPAIGSLATNQTNRWISNVPLLLVAGAGLAMASYHVRDKWAEERFAQEYQQEYDAMMRENTAIATANLEI